MAGSRTLTFCMDVPVPTTHACLFPTSGVVGSHCALGTIANPQQVPPCKRHVHRWTMAG